MNINNVSSTNSAALHGMRSMQKPDPAKMAEDLFSKLDTKNQGYLEKADLSAVLSKISGSGDSSGSTSADEMFAKLDGDGDGEVTKSEMSATFEQIASQLDGPFPRMRMQGQGGDMPPPGDQQDEGLSKDQLTSMLEDAGSTDSKKTDILTQLVNNFDAADSNGDGKITRDEARSYNEKSTSNTSNTSVATSSSQSANTSDMQFMKKMMELMRAYGGFNSDSQSSSFSTSA